MLLWEQYILDTKFVCVLKVRHNAYHQIILYLTQHLFEIFYSYLSYFSLIA